MDLDGAAHAGRGVPVHSGSSGHLAWAGRLGDSRDRHGRRLEEFLQLRAPKWHQVGRVCFHLAKNKNDKARPFAFLATYSTGFGAGGQLKHVPLRKALEQCAGAKNRPALIKLLSPVHQAAERCEWVRELVDSGEIYQPLAWTAERAYTFLRTAPALEESGVAIRLPDWWKKRSRPQVSVQIGRRKASALGTDAMLDFNVKLALGDETTFMRTPMMIRVVDVSSLRATRRYSAKMRRNASECGDLRN